MKNVETTNTNVEIPFKVLEKEDSEDDHEAVGPVPPKSNVAKNHPDKTGSHLRQCQDWTLISSGSKQQALVPPHLLSGLLTCERALPGLAFLLVQVQVARRRARCVAVHLFKLLQFSPMCGKLVAVPFQLLKYFLCE